MKRQPRWPDHFDPVPPCLQPWRPDHYALLLLWIFFQPSHLKNYLYRADPDLYTQRGWAAFWRAMTRVPAYRNVWLMGLFILPPMSGIVGLIFNALNLSFDWVVWAIFVAYGVAGGVAFGMRFSMVGGVAFGVPFGVAGGVAGCVTGGMTVSVAFGMALGVALGMAFGVTFDVVFSVVVGVALSVAGGVVFGMPGGVAFSIAGGVAGSVGAIRLPLYLLRAMALVAPPSRRSWLWIEDEYTIFPLWGLDKWAGWALAISLEEDDKEKLRTLQLIMANPFQRWAGQRTLTTLAQQQPKPLLWLYALSHTEVYQIYGVLPLNKKEFEELCPLHWWLLAELGQQFVGDIDEAGFAWFFTKRLRYRQPTPISQFSGLMFELLRDEEELTSMPVAEIRLAERYAPRYQGVRALPQGEEIATLYETLAQGLAVTAWAELVALPLSAQTWESPILPTQQQARLALSDVLALLRHYDQATNLNQRTLALNRANSMLKELSDYVTAEVQPPEQVLWLRLLEHWRDFVATQQGLLAQAALHALSPLAHQSESLSPQATLWQQPAQPFDNPYIAGRPVTPPLFVGRNDIYRQIAATWSAQSTPDSIILYGHRRMGKSSILRNIPLFIPLTGLFVYSDLSGDTSFVTSAADLILELASKLHHAAQQQGQSLPAVPPSDYTNAHDAQYHFNRLLEQVAGRVYFALDEFEAIDVAVAEGHMGQEIYGFLRSYAMGNTSHNLTFILGGLHTLDEMSHAYHQAFFGSYRNILVSYLSPETAWQLITNPTEDFTLNYDPAAVARIIHESGGQPLLIQQLCREALNHLNHTMFDLGQRRPALITLSDVEMSLEEILSPRGNTYFLGVWAQLTDDEPRLLIRALAQRDAPWSLPDIRHVSPLSEEQLLAHLTWATRHDLLRQATPHTWQFCVPLMRQWVARLEG